MADSQSKKGNKKRSILDPGSPVPTTPEDRARVADTDWADVPDAASIYLATPPKHKVRMTTGGPPK